MRFLVLLVGFALFVGALMLGWTFRANNEGTVDLDLVWIQFAQIQLWALLLSAVGLGATLATLVVGFAWLRGKMVVNRYKKMLKKLEKEVHELRSLPLVGSEPSEPLLDLPGGAAGTPPPDAAIPSQPESTAKQV